MREFDRYARYYDLLYRDKDYAGETNYTDRLIQRFAPGARRLFELGCGSGGHALFLAQKGYSVFGIDRAENMLKQAESARAAAPVQVAQRLSFSHGDILTFRAEECFDTVISLFHVMSYQTADEDLARAFATASSHLESGGIFLFDCWYGPAVLAEPPVLRVKRMEDDLIEVTRIAEPVGIPDQNSVAVHYDLFIRDKAAGDIHEVRETHTMRYLFPEEVKLLLKQAGMTLLHAEEWVSGREPGEDTWSVCFAARK